MEKSWDLWDVFDASKSFYRGEVMAAEISKKFNGVPRQKIEALVKKLPENLNDNIDSLSLTRAINELIGMRRESVYTEKEWKFAILSVLKGTLSQTQASKQFGMPRRTIFDHCERLTKQYGDQLCSLIENDIVSRPKKGPTPYLSKDEEAVLVNKCAVAAQHGDGYNKVQLSLQGQQLCKQLAENEASPVKRRKLEGAKCGDTWIKKLTKENGEFSFLKPNDLSQNRAAAKVSSHFDSLFAKIEKMYSLHRAAGILKTPNPEPSQIWNGDEVGFDPKGKWTRVLAHKNTKVMRVTTGEKAPFWVSVFFFTRAD
eukprot:Pompholyxophrys_sp_v1_NODE_114_length_1891_cov_7.971678.p1 type:complete len:313 gc:universal NODE_114_length_1891_cov_7.971678:1309-371(-)